MGATPREFESRILRHARPVLARRSWRSAIASPAQAPPAREESSGRVAARYVAPALLCLSFAAIAVTQLLGPSATEAPLGANDNGATPPWHASTSPSPWLVSGLLALAVAAGVATLWLGLTGRWRPRPKRVIAASALAVGVLGLLAPIGSADPLSYAAYGRMVTTGHDPYTTAPSSLAATDPVERAVEIPWQHTPSVYGPVATAEQALASKLAGRNVALTILLLDLVGAVVFIATALLLYRIAPTDEVRLRGALLWTANPLLWLQLVAGAHLDVLAAGAVLAAVAIAVRSRIAAGALVGVAVSIKAPTALVWVALAWAARRSRRAVAALTAGALVVAGVGYGVAGAGAFRELNRASRQVSLATPWRLVSDLTDPAFGHGASRRVIGALAFVVFVAVVVALHRLNPEVRGGSPTALAFALSLAYVLSAPYTLPWYDAVPWVLLPLLATSRLDALLAAHTAVLSLAYIPGRAAYRLTGAMHAVAFGMRDAVSPIVLIALLLALAAASTRHASRPASLAPPRSPG
ncbi:MAG TPA: polyprenol phosphomannose-dependent alpha 1,6 mannosyltransferase MptB [Mycobacteriales bacterium]|nr:polyprenol phosphomannose-dependent alpha 1,6 mannosyltransferase MptB [Mycobacteriales bacterium]